mmetsp:Transcript_21314/g.53114  ORF Transcript_21314/g.53114 Transcript_21314/m.53114 type:complete len:237 (+) Transcript_21314:158-868(+)
MSLAFCISTLTASWKSTSGGKAPVVSTEKMKWSRILPSLTLSAQLGYGRTRHMLQPRGLVTSGVGRSPSAKSKRRAVGLRGAASSSAHPPAAFSCARGVEAKVMAGSRRYDAVHTGDHLAWVLPIPFSHHASNSISWPGRSFAMRMSSCTGRMGCALKRSCWSPCGIHCSMAEVTLSFTMSLDPLPVSGFCREHSTLSRKEITFSSLASSSGAREWNLRGSARMGRRPRRWARTSS